MKSLGCISILAAWNSTLVLIKHSKDIVFDAFLQMYEMVCYCMSMNGNINRPCLAPASGFVFTPKKPINRESHP